MTLKKYLLLMFLATLICWLSFGVVVYFVDPTLTNWFGFLIFYLSLFLSLVGSLSLLGFIVRFIVNKNEFAFKQVITAFRQSILFAFLVSAALFLQSYRLVSWWNFLILIILLTVIEFLFIARENKTKIIQE